MIPLAAMGLVSATGAWLLGRAFEVQADEHNVSIPVSGITGKQWLDFVRVCSNGNPKAVTPSNRLGIFELSVRRLCDLGAMTRPRIVDNVWQGEWVQPKNLDSFKGDLMAQYSLFARSISDYAADPIVLLHKGCIVGSETMTLSGVLAVANRAGMQGLASWVASPSEREKFSRNTTSFFQRANNLF